MGKHWLVFALCLVLTAALLTGCWGDDDSSSSAMPPASSSGTVSSSSETLKDEVSSDISDILDGSMPGDASGSMSGSVSGSTSGSGSVSGSTSGSLSGSGTNGSSAAAPAAATPGGQEWALRLVNAANPLPADFAVQTKAIAGYENRLFDARAAEALETLLHDAQAAGHQLYLVSAYRSVDRQAALFRRKTESFVKEGFPPEEAEKQAAMWVARPGTSEHNLGLAADIVSSDWYKTNSDLTADFEATAHYRWLQANAATYGFVVRYPKGKEAVTGVTYEPWHYRYVGMEAARAMTAQGLTLEEYTAQR